jgi:hypothetical protein
MLGPQKLTAERISAASEMSSSGLQRAAACRELGNFIAVRFLKKKERIDAESAKMIQGRQALP